MTISLNIEGDFTAVVDGGEQVTVHRSGTTEQISIPSALRAAVETSEQDVAEGAASATDVVWQFEMIEATSSLAIGDSIVDALGQTWTILSIEVLQGGARVRCATRSLELYHQLDQRMTIEQATWEDEGAGPVVTAWSILRPAVPVRIQPLETTVDLAASPPSSTTRYRILLADDLLLDHNHRLTDVEGNRYQINRYTPAERVDMLAVVEASIESEASIS